MRSNNLTGTGLVDKYIGTSYDVVRQVYEKLELIELVANQIDIQKGEKGDQGNTVYVANEYSADQVSWHTDLRVTDLYRRVATVTNEVFGSWSPAVNIQGLRGDTVYIEYQYSADNVEFHFGLTEDDYYRRERTVTITPIATEYGEFTAGTLIRIDGSTPVRGEDYTDGLSTYTSFIYKNSIDQPADPIGGSYTGTLEDIPETWTTDPSTPSSGWFVWVSKRVYTQNAEGNWDFNGWSTPAKFSGEQGYTPIKDTDYFDGVNGILTSLIFTNAVNAPVDPVGGSFDGTTETIPAAWTDDPSSPSAGESTWVSKRTYNYNGSVWVGSTWTSPALFSYHPALGIDYFNGAAGTFTSFVYKVAAIAPVPPSGGSYNGSNETIPTGWTDDLVAPSGSNYVWISRRIYSDNGGTWEGGAWSDPIQFTGTSGKTPDKGTDYFDGISGSFISFVFKNAVTRPVTPTGGTFDGANETFPANWTDDPTATTGTEFTWMSKARYSYVDAEWQHVGWTLPVRFSAEDGVTTYTWTAYADDALGNGISLLKTDKEYVGYAFNQAEATVDISDSSVFSWSIFKVGDIVDIEDMQGDIADLIENTIWNTVQHQEKTTDVVHSTAEIKDVNVTISNETTSRVTQGDQLTAAIETEKGRIDSEITRINQVEVDITGNAQAISVLDGQVNNETNGLSASFTLASSAITDAANNATAINLLTNTVTSNTSDISATNTLAQSAVIDASNNATAINVLTNTVADNTADISATNTLAQTASVDASNNATAITVLTNIVTDNTNDISATNTLAQTASIDAGNNATAINSLTNTVTNNTSNITAANSLAQSASIDASNNATAITALQSTVNDSNTGMAATSALALSAKQTADDNVSAVATLQASLETMVSDGTATEAELQLLVEGNINDIASLRAEAYLFVDVNGRIAGMKASSTAALSSLSFFGEQVEFVRADGSKAIYFDTVTGQYKFDGAIHAGAGSIIDGLYVEDLTVGTSKITDQAINQPTSVEIGDLTTTGTSQYTLHTVSLGTYTSGSILFNFSVNGNRPSSSDGDDEYLDLYGEINAGGAALKRFTFKCALPHKNLPSTSPMCGVFSDSLLAGYVGQNLYLKLSVQARNVGANDNVVVNAVGYVQYAKK